MNEMPGLDTCQAWEAFQAWGFPDQKFPSQAQKYALSRPSLGRARFGTASGVHYLWGMMTGAHWRWEAEAPPRSR